jgi:hypothetical protein
MTSKLHLFIDEKGGFSPKDKSNEPFILLGISIQDEYLDEFYEKMMAFKRTLRPGDCPLSWELKGARGFYDVNQKPDTTKLRDMWESFAEFIANIGIPFHTFCTISNRNKIKQLDENKDINWNNKKFNHSFMRINFYYLLFSFLVLEQRKSEIVFEEDLITPNEYQFPFHVFYDELNDSSVEKQFNEIYSTCLEQLNVSVKSDFSFIRFESGKRECLAIEFVDMIIYTLHRFLIGKDVLELSDTYDSLFKYYSRILHSIRFSFIKNVFFGKSSTGFSSCVLLSEHRDYNFAVKLENAMVEFAHGERVWNKLNL